MKFEHHIDFAVCRSEAVGNKVEELEYTDDLFKLRSSEGWELVAVLPQNYIKEMNHLNEAFDCFWKRPVEE